MINGAETASGCSAQSYLIGLVNESCNQSAQTKEPVGFDLPAFFFSQQQKNLSDLSHSRHAVISELVRLDLRHFKYYRYHLTVATRTAEHDEQYLKLFFQRWRTFCDLKQFKFACFDQDGTEHLHIVLWSEKPFELGYELPFKAPSLRLQPVSNGWQTPSINGYSLVCLRPHNSAENIFSYILSDRNFNLDCLRSSRRHFYSTSQGINTVALKRAFRRFCVISGTVRKSTEQLGTVLSQLQDTQERAESVQSFITELFGISRDGAPGRSNEINNTCHRSPRLTIPYSESKRRQHLFFQYEYLPFPEREIDLIIPDLSTFGPKFQSRLIPKLLYDMVWHAWAKDPCMSVPPIPLEDFYSDDFLSVGAESSFELPTNPNYLASRQLSLSVLKT